MKLLAATATLLGALCAPALADTPPPTASAPPADAPVALKLSLTTGTDTRVYELSLVESSCGTTREKIGDREDAIDVCARGGSANKSDIRLEVNWSTMQRSGERKGHTSVVVARGATAVVAATANFRLELAAK